MLDIKLEMVSIHCYWFYETMNPPHVSGTPPQISIADGSLVPSQLATLSLLAGRAV